MATMKDIVDRMKEDGDVENFPKVELNHIVGETFEAMKRMLRDGERILISEFGVFTAPDRKERLGYNPVTKKTDITIPVHKIVKFRCLPALKEYVNSKE